MKLLEDHSEILENGVDQKNELLGAAFRDKVKEVQKELPKLTEAMDAQKQGQKETGDALSKETPSSCGRGSDKFRQQTDEKHQTTLHTERWWRKSTKSR